MLFLIEPVRILTKQHKYLFNQNSFRFGIKSQISKNIPIKLKKSARNGKLKDSKQYTQALILVDKALKHQLQDITGGAKFYFNPKLVKPSWANKMIKTVTIGNHDFYKLQTTKIN